MSSIFLSHSSIDKPFVEKLANDLIRLGVKVWFDKWEIKIGESLRWKIKDSRRANEYLGIVLSPEALLSEWVRYELNAGLAKQLIRKKIVVLPILYRDCDIPRFLQGIKYANFKNNYDDGLQELADVFGIKNSALISVSNWRRFKGDKSSNWKLFKEEEFGKLVTTLVNCAKEFNWSSWVGGRNSYSICLRAWIERDKRKSVNIRLDGKSNAYMASFEDTWNPNHLKATDFDLYVGNTINAAEEFVWRIMDDFRMMHGNPVEKAEHHTHKFLTNEEKIQMGKELLQKWDWYNLKDNS